MFNILGGSKQVKSKKEYYLGLILKEDEGTAIILAVDAGTKKIVNLDEKRFKYSSSWERIIEDVDEALFELEEKNKIKVEKVIFFLPSHLIDQKNKEIKKPYKNSIKAISKELELKPLGFIEYHEAISVYLGYKEEVSLSAIIIELDRPQITVFIYRGGGVIFSSSRAKTQDLTADLESIFDDLNDNIILPARIILNDSSTHENEAEKIISHRWDDRLFIQIPRVEIMLEQELKEALVYTVSQQLFQKEEAKIAPENEEAILGFAIGRDIKDKADLPKEDLDIEDGEIEYKEEPAYSKEESVQTYSTQKKSVQQIFTGFYQSALTRTGPLFSKFKSRPKFVPLAIVGLLLILGSLYLIIYSFHKADVIIYFKGEREKKEIAIKAALNTASDKKVLGIKKFEETAAREESIETTGKKTIGEKSKGEVTIHNWDGVDKTFKKSTVLTAPSGIKFILDNEVKVASASEVSVGVKQTGKTKASVSAVEIGPDGNVDKNQKLKIEDFSVNTYFAQPNDAFSGGSKKDLQTASKDDLAKLKEKTIEKIKKEEDKIIAENVGGAKIIAPLTSVDIVDEKYSKEVGEEGKSISLKANGKIVFYTFKERDLKNIILEEFKNLIPKSHRVLAKDVNYKINDAKISGKTADLGIDATATSISKIDEDKLLSDIVGRDTKLVEDLIKEKYKAAGYDAKIKTSIPFLNVRLPFFKKNISLRIDSL